MQNSLTILRPELAVRGYHLTEKAVELERVKQREAYVRTRVYARAHKDIFQALDGDGDARILLKRALGRHENLLSGYEVARARAWFDSVSEDECREAFELLFGLNQDALDHSPEAFAQRLDQFFSRVEPRQLAKDRVAHINETLTSYFLAMYEPDRYPFVKLESTFQPAYRLLVDPLGERATSSSGRLVTAQALYSHLKNLWSEESDFTGDLLDVHTRLFILGSGSYPEFSWARALLVEDLASLVSSHLPLEQEYREPFLQAAELMRDSCVDLGRPEDLYHGLTLEDYAHTAGQSARTLAHVVEHGTRSLARLELASADAFGLSLARDGSWRVAGQDGKTREEAEAFFETRIKPMLRELSQVALLLKGEVQDVELSLLISEPYRALDAKLLVVTLCALDPEWSWQHLFPVHSQGEIAMLLELLGIESGSVQTFTEYLDFQFNARAILQGLDVDIPAGALVFWLRTHPLGQMLRGYLALNEEEGVLQEASASSTQNKSPALTRADLAVALDEANTSNKVSDGGGMQGGGHEHPAWRVEPPIEDAWGAFIAAIFDARHERLARLLRARKNVVLYGPPGTGKTILSTQLATLWRRWQKSHGYMDSGNQPCVEQVTFHPSYGYEEFIEGFRPRQDHPGEFVLTQGILSRMAARAEEHPEHCFLLLIDELNRGDVARIFGELITLIEADKRSPEHARRRMLSQEPLWLPPNLYLLATMNTADKSISLLDVAIRRRFAFERVPPQPSLLARTPGLVHQVQDVYLSTLLAALNDRLSRIGVYPERWLGHSFLWLDERVVDDPLEAVATRFRLDIIPLVEEYCFADKRQMTAVLGSLVDAQGQPNEQVLSSGRFLDALRDIVDEYQEDQPDQEEYESGADGLSRAWQDAYVTRHSRMEQEPQRYAPDGKKEK